MHHLNGAGSVIYSASVAEGAKIANLLDSHTAGAALYVSMGSVLDFPSSASPANVASEYELRNFVWGARVWPAWYVMPCYTVENRYLMNDLCADQCIFFGAGMEAPHLWVIKHRSGRVLLAKNRS